MTLLSNRNFLLLWQAQFVSQLGNQAFLIATTLFILEKTGSPTSVAATMVGATVPLVVLAPIGGSIADRHARRSILILTDLFRAASIGGLTALVLGRSDLAATHLGFIVAVAIFNGTMSALFTPALQSFVPELVSADRLGTANSINQMSSQAATLVGQALGGILYVAWGPAVLLGLDALSFAYAGIASCFLPQDRRVRQTATGVALTLRRYVTDTATGMAYLWRRAGMFAVLAIFAAVNCLFMPVFVLLPFYVSDVLERGAEWYGFLLSASGAGALAGSLTASVALGRCRRHAALVRMCLSGIAAGVLTLAANDTPWIAAVVFVFVGKISSIVNVAVMTAFQSSVDSEIRGRVMALLIALSTAAVPIGIALGGVLGDVLRSSLPIALACIGTAIAVLAVLSWTTRGFEHVFKASGRIVKS